MSYRRKADFDQPTAEDIEQMRKVNVWLLPILFFQQASLIFRDDFSPVTRYFGLAAWASMILIELALLSSWRFGWLGDRVHELLNDEWHRAIAGDASRWGLAAVASLGFAMVVADRWVEFDGSKAIFVLVNGGMLTAGLRYAWLNRGVPDEE